MLCLRCNAKMKHYQLEIPLKIHGAENAPDLFSRPQKKSYSAKSAYICENCGYIELNTNFCENPDI